MAEAVAMVTYLRCLAKYYQQNKKFSVNRDAMTRLMIKFFLILQILFQF